MTSRPIKVPSRMRNLVAILAATALLVGCGGQPADKAGGKGGDVRVLRLANGNDQPGELAAYAREVKRLSGGRLVIADRTVRGDRLRHRAARA